MRLLDNRPAVSDWRKYDIAFGCRIVFCLLAVSASHVGPRSGAWAGSNAGRQADLAGIEKFHQLPDGSWKAFRGAVQLNELVRASR